MIPSALTQMPSLALSESLRVALSEAVSEVEVTASRGSAAQATAKADELAVVLAEVTEALADFVTPEEE